MRRSRRVAPAAPAAAPAVPLPPLSSRSIPSLWPGGVWLGGDTVLVGPRDHGAGAPVPGPKLCICNNVPDGTSAAWSLSERNRI